MSTRTIKTPDDAKMFYAWLAGMPMPYTISVRKGVQRSTAQNRMQRKWCAEVAEQREDLTAEYVRGYSKAHFGVPILLAEDEEFAEKYEIAIKPLPYETKIAIMQEPLDLPVTRRMNVAQKVRYLDAMHAYWTTQGIHLTSPEAFT